MTAASTVVVGLTEREVAILLLFAEDFGPREIAQRLGVSPWTVEGDRRNAKRKFGVSTTTAAVAIVVRALTIAAKYPEIGYGAG